MATTIEVKGLDELIARMQAYPDKLKAAVKVALDSSLLALWGAVPPYPPAPNSSGYVRTGTLGRSLGSSDGGGMASSAPSIYVVKPMGDANYEAHFGTNLSYAPYVIGDNTQAWMHKGRWWIISDIAAAAKEKIQAIFGQLEGALVEFLEGWGNSWGNPGMGE